MDHHQQAVGRLAGMCTCEWADAKVQPRESGWKSGTVRGSIDRRVGLKATRFADAMLGVKPAVSRCGHITLPPVRVYHSSR
jgi:hypothetical protein